MSNNQYPNNHLGEPIAKGSHITKTENKYNMPTTLLNDLDESATNYLKSRGITEVACKNYDVSMDYKGNIVFPYYDENNVYTFSKVIDVAEKNIRIEKGTKPILFGMNRCNFDESLVITCSDWDTLALASCGVGNVVGVPNSLEDLTFLETCYEWIGKFKKIIIWRDNEVSSLKMINSLILKLGEDRCWKVVVNDFKNINELLMNKGKEGVIDELKKAEAVPVNGLIKLAEYVEDDKPYIRIGSGIREFDKTIGGFNLGEVSVWTGVNASGKSTFLGQMIIESIEQGYGVCAYSGELNAKKFRSWIERQMAGKENLIYEYNTMMEKELPKVSPEAIEKLRKWYHDKLIFLDSFGGIKSSMLIQLFRVAVKKFNCKVFLLDNLMTTFYDGAEKDFYRQQSLYVAELISFAQQYEVHVHLVAHPRKVSGDVNKADIGGSGDITNRADNVFDISRVNKGTDENGDSNEKQFYQYDNKLKIIKNREFGVENLIIPLLFEPESKRYYMTEQEGKKCYSWNKTRDDGLRDIYGKWPF